uniref:AN1-type domain-containing protein n=1 Tax=Leersia perrieri TaxID=77586 RepID=A0A0D9X879_9ORYZ
MARTPHRSEGVIQKKNHTSHFSLYHKIKSLQEENLVTDFMSAKQTGLAAAAAGGGATPCANSCGLFGTSRTENLCARCYRDHLNAIDAAAESEKARALLASLTGSYLGGGAAAETAAANCRCSSCQRKVGNLGFACRCGGTFCSEHRHGDAHGCGFAVSRARGRSNHANW